MKFLDPIPLWVPLLFSLTIGLAPLTPPHVWEKLGLLFAGQLARPLDIFDLALHGAPWLLLAAKLARLARARPAAGS